MTTPDRRRFLATVGMAASAWPSAASRATCLTPAPAAGQPPPNPRLPDVGPGQRFSADGQAQRWPGCTLISQLPPSNPLFALLCETRDRLRDLPVLRTKLTWMPEHSYHMTVCDLVNVAHRGSRRDWPAALPLDAPLEAACDHVGAVLRRWPTGDRRPFRMRLDAKAARTGLTADGQPRTYVLWLPAEREDAQRLQSLRERVYTAVGIHHPGERDYTFHTTLSYPIALFTQEEAADYDRLYVERMKELGRRLPVVEWAAPDYCLFDSMYLFEPQFPVS